MKAMTKAEVSKAKRQLKKILKNTKQEDNDTKSEMIFFRGCIDFAKEYTEEQLKNMYNDYCFNDPDIHNALAVCRTEKINQLGRDKNLTTIPTEELDKIFNGWAEEYR